MKLALFFCLIFAAHIAHAVTVDGFCYLEGQQNHSGTKVKFIKVSPSAVTDSTFTQANGYFTKNLVPGIYNVQYSRVSYEAQTVLNQLFISNTTLTNIYLESSNGISGEVEGTLNGYYKVVGNLTINIGDTLTILPGTTLRFDGPYTIQVFGFLQSLGNQSDSVKFIRDYNFGFARWSGIYLSTYGAATFQYTEFSGSYSSTGGSISSEGHYLSVSHCLFVDNMASRGGAISATHAAVYIEFSNFLSNSASERGGAIQLTDTTGYVNECIFQNCAITTGSTGGGAIYLFNSRVEFTRCHFLRNSASGYDMKGGCIFSEYGAPQFHSCQFDSCFVNPGGSSQGRGGAIFARFGSLSLDSCKFHSNNVVLYNNSALRGGALCLENLSISSSACEYDHNIAGQQINPASYGGAMCLSNVSGLVQKSTFFGNAATYGGNIYCESSTVLLRDCAITYAYYGEDIRFTYSPNVQVQFSNIYGSQSTGFGNYWEAPPAFGQKLVTNANGDSADIYENIFENPMFTDTAHGDYSLLPNSPCIDAGDPDLPLDPDGTIADIGASFFLQDITVAPHALAFGSVPVMSSDTLFAQVRNSGNQTITVSSMVATDSRFHVARIYGDSILTSHDSLGVRVIFTPTTAGFFSGELRIVSNAPVNDTLTVALSGEGGIIPAPVDHVVLQIQGSDAHVCWSPVDTSIHGSPITVDAYLVYFSESANGPFWFHGLTTDTCYVHAHAAQFASSMFYQVTAFIGNVQAVTQIVNEHNSEITREDLQQELQSGLWRIPIAARAFITRKKW